MYVISQHMYHLNGSKVKDMLKSSAATEMFLISKQTLQEDIKTLTGRLARPAGVELFVLFIYRSLSLSSLMCSFCPPSSSVKTSLRKSMTITMRRSRTLWRWATNTSWLLGTFLWLTSHALHLLKCFFCCVTSLLTNSVMGLFRAYSLVQ